MVSGARASRSARCRISTPRKGASYASRATALMTARAVHFPPRAVAMPRSVKRLGNSVERRDAFGPDCFDRPDKSPRPIIGAGNERGASGLAAILPQMLRAVRIAQLDALSLSAAARASRVRREIASRSCCATSAMIPTVKAFASGMSAGDELQRRPFASRSGNGRRGSSGRASRLGASRQ